MIESVYKRRQKPISLESQVKHIIRKSKNSKCVGEYGMSLIILTDIPIDDEHDRDVLIFTYAHPNDYIYIYMCDETHGHVPCGIIRCEPYKLGGPMFKEGWFKNKTE